MNCARARTELALWAGGDLDERATGLLERHVAVCPDCRDHRRGIAGSLQTLYDSNTPPVDGLYDSIWPTVASRLTAQSEAAARRADRLNRWLPAAAVAAACLAVIAFTSEPQPRRQDVYGQALPDAGMMILQPAQRDDQNVFAGPRRPVDPLNFPFQRRGARSRPSPWLDELGLIPFNDAGADQLRFAPRRIKSSIRAAKD